jgi:O-antigen/teichoic acid export membrane protein
MKERQPLTIRHNFSWTFLGNTIYAASQWAMLTVLAKLGSPKMVGQFALALAVTTPVITFANLALRQVQATDSRRIYLFGDYLALRLYTTLLALVTLAGIAISARYGLYVTLIILMMGVAKGFEALSDVFYGLLQNRERMDRIAISMMIKGLLSLAALGTAVALTRSVFWGVTALAVSWLCVLIGYDIRSGARVLHAHTPDPETRRGETETLLPRWSFRVLRSLVWLTLPLGFATMLNTLSVNIPRYYIERRFGPYELGIFAAMAYVLLAGTTVVNALGQAASPRLARYYADGNVARFGTLLLKLTGLGTALGLAGILITLVAGKPLLTLLYRPEYARRLDVFVWLNFGAMIGYVASFLGYGMTASRYFKPQPFVYALACLMAVLCSRTLIPHYGLLGAAWTIVALNLVQLTAALLCNLHAIARLRAHAQAALCDAGVV